MVDGSHLTCVDLVPPGRLLLAVGYAFLIDTTVNSLSKVVVVIGLFSAMFILCGYIMNQITHLSKEEY